MSNVTMKLEKKSKYFIPAIRKIVCSRLNLENEQLDVTTRKREIVQARQLAMYFAKEYTTASLSTIGSEIGKKDHATVLHAVKTVNNLNDTDRNFRGIFFMIKEKIEQSSELFENSEYDMICIDCGSKNVHSKAWINPNTKKFVEDIENSYKDPQDNWCGDCNANVQLILRSEYNKLNAPPPELTEDQILWNKKLEEIENEFK